MTEYPIPETKKGFPVGTLNLEFDKDDNPWVGVMYQSAIAKFDKKTETFKTGRPASWDTNMGQLGHLALEGTPVDNKVWIKNSDGGNIYRLNLGSNQMENLGAFDPRTGQHIGTSASIPTPRTTSICSISRPATSSKSTLRPSRRPST